MEDKKYEDSNHLFAMKIVIKQEKKRNEVQDVSEMAIEEARTVMSLRHPHIVSIAPLISSSFNRSFIYSG